MAPSVIYIDEVEKVFLTDKKKLREFGSIELFSRIKKDLAKVRAGGRTPRSAHCPGFPRGRGCGCAHLEASHKAWCRG